jgi:hypothetical protein
MIMAETLDELQAQLIALNRARAKGVRSIVYETNGVKRSTEFRSDTELREAQNDLQRRIAALSGNTNRTVTISSSKGLDHHDER